MHVYCTTVKLDISSGVWNFSQNVELLINLLIYYLYQTTKIHNSERNYNYN